MNPSLSLPLPLPLPLSLSIYQTPSLPLPQSTQLNSTPLAFLPHLTSLDSNRPEAEPSARLELDLKLEAYIPNANHPLNSAQLRPAPPSSQRSAHKPRRPSSPDQTSFRLPLPFFLPFLPVIS